MNTIFKYNLPVDETSGRQHIVVEMPRGAEVLSVGLDIYGKPCVWAVFDRLKVVMAPREFWVFWTGTPLPNAVDAPGFVGRFEYRGCVFHLFEPAWLPSQPLEETSHMSQLDRDSEPMLQFFEYADLPPNLQEFSKPWHDLAVCVVDTLPRNPERTVALRKLLEGKDCAVRARLLKPGPQAA